jgi:hypothetical protein
MLIVGLALAYIGLMLVITLFALAITGLAILTERMTPR